MEFLAVEVGLELMYLLAVGVHVLLSAVPILVDLLDDDFGVAIGKEPLDAKGGSDPETVDKGLILGCIVSGLEEYLQDVFLATHLSEG